MTWLTLTAYLWVQSLAERAGGALRREDGQGLTEYALIIALIAVVVVGAVLLLGKQISHVFSGVSTCLSGASNGAAGASKACK